MPEAKTRNVGNNGNGRGNGGIGILNKDDLEQIYIENSRRMLATAYYILHNVEDTEDAVQSAFLQLSKHYSAFRGESKISTYLHRTVVNESLAIIEHKERRKETSLEQECEDGRLISRMPSIDGRVHDINRIDIERAISNLPHGQRKICILHDYLGCKHREIAQTLGRSLSNAKSQLHKARKKLKTALNPERNQEPKQNHKKDNNNGFNLHEELESLQHQFLLTPPNSIR